MILRIKNTNSWFYWIWKLILESVHITFLDKNKDQCSLFPVLEFSFSTRYLYRFVIRAHQYSFISACRERNFLVNFERVSGVRANGVGDRKQAHSLGNIHTCTYIYVCTLWTNSQVVRSGQVHARTRAHRVRHSLRCASIALCYQHTWHTFVHVFCVICSRWNDKNARAKSRLICTHAKHSAQIALDADLNSIERRRCVRVMIAHETAPMTESALLRLLRVSGLNTLRESIMRWSVERFEW